MESLNVHWKVPGRDGNTCYRPSAKSPELFEVSQEASSSLNNEITVSFEETLLTSSDEKNNPELLIEGRRITDWINSMNSPRRDWWDTTGKPALRSQVFSVLLEEEFLTDLIRFVLNKQKE